MHKYKVWTSWGHADSSAPPIAAAAAVYSPLAWQLVGRSMDKPWRYLLSRQDWWRMEWMGGKRRWTWGVSTAAAATVWR